LARESEAAFSMSQHGHASSDPSGPGADPADAASAPPHLRLSSNPTPNDAFSPAETEATTIGSSTTPITPLDFEAAPAAGNWRGAARGEWAPHALGGRARGRLESIDSDDSSVLATSGLRRRAAPPPPLDLGVAALAPPPLPPLRIPAPPEPGAAGAGLAPLWGSGLTALRSRLGGAGDALSCAGCGCASAASPPHDAVRPRPPPRMPASLEVVTVRGSGALHDPLVLRVLETGGGGPGSPGTNPVEREPGVNHSWEARRQRRAERQDSLA
jgi:hypothetical protein